MMAPEGFPGMGAPQQPEGGDMASDVRQIIQAVRAFADANGTSEQERLVVEKITTLLQQLSSDREKEEQGMLQGKLSPGAMSRAYAGG